MQRVLKEATPARRAELTAVLSADRRIAVCAPSSRRFDEAASDLDPDQVVALGAGAGRPAG